MVFLKQISFKGYKRQLNLYSSPIAVKWFITTELRLHLTTINFQICVFERVILWDCKRIFQTACVCLSGISYWTYSQWEGSGGRKGVFEPGEEHSYAQLAFHWGRFLKATEHQSAPLFVLRLCVITFRYYFVLLFLQCQTYTLHDFALHGYFMSLASIF